MKLAIILGLIFVFVLGVVSVEAKEYTLNLPQGWNLVSGSILHCSQDCGYTPYFYLALYNKYIKYDPSDEQSSKELQSMMDNNPDYFSKYVFSPPSYPGIWLYVEKPLTQVERSDVNGLDTPETINNVYLIKGWNFVSIFPLMEGKEINDFRGNCDITSAYMFDTQNNQWVKKKDAFYSTDIFKGVLVYVVNNCKLSAQSQSPPPLPQ